MLIYELSKTMQMGKQTDLILLDFSKAFDKVAHEKLIQKLHHYSIRGDTLKWIKDFLDNRGQAVVINGVNPSPRPAGLSSRPIISMTHQSRSVKSKALC